MRYKPDTIAAWPVDIMLVEDHTFAKLYNDSRNVSMGVATVKAASPRHLATLKIHALKNYQEDRFARDYNDLLQLLRGECRDISTDDLRDLCVRYADEELYHKILKDLGGAL